MHDPEKRKSYLSIFEQISENQSKDKGKNGHAYHALHPTEPHDTSEYGDDDSESTLLTDEIDHLILMHRDAHFGGDFEVMIIYYKNDDHIGIQPDFDLERILYLSEVEREIGQDLAPIILTGSEAEAVGRSRAAYAQFKEIYEIEDEKSPFPRLISDLILTEEEEPEEEIERVVSQGTAIVPDLLYLLKSEELYDPLFPGYGYAPYLAAYCLGKIGDPQAIIPLFELLSKEIVFDEMVAVDALEEIGEPAKEFLIKVLKSRPLTQDNPSAAFALIIFSQDSDVAVTCFEQLQDPDVQEKPLLRTYLLCCCETLNSPPYKETFIAMANNPKTHPDLAVEMKRMIQDWEEE